MISRIALLVVFLLLVRAAETGAQTAITVTVTDNAVVANVQVTATNEVTGEANALSESLMRRLRTGVL